MEGNIPVPAETARTIATEAASNISDMREDGYKATSRRMEQGVSQVLAETAGKDGEYVSIDSTLFSSLVTAAESRSARDTARLYLEQYNVW